MIALGDNYYDCLVLCSRTFLIRLTRFLPPSALSIFLPSYSTVTYSGPSSLALAITFSCSHFPSWSSRGMAMLIEFWWRVTEQGTALGGAVLTENQSSAMRLMEDGIKEKKTYRKTSHHPYRHFRLDPPPRSRSRSCSRMLSKLQT